MDQGHLKEYGFIRKRFTLVIPARIRDYLHLKENDPIEISVVHDQILIAPVKEDPFVSLERLCSGIIFDRKSRMDAEQYAMKLVETENRML